MDKAPITKAGFARLEAALKQLKTVERPSVAEQIAAAREHGDLKENAEYHAAREKQSFLEGQIAQFEDWIARADIVDTSKLSGDRVVFGASVEIYDVDSEEEFTYRIVGEYEADINQNLVSITSPIARGLIGKEVDDVVKIKTPGGVKEYEIVSVSFA